MLRRVARLLRVRPVHRQQRGAFSEAQRRVLDEEKTFLTGLEAVVERAGASPEELRTVREARQQLDELFLVVVVGEFNSGKSTLINALLGQRLLADGVTPTTAKINIVKYGAAGDDHASDDAAYVAQDMCVHRFDVPWLREINIVDTPGTNAVFVQHQALTEQFLPRADLVLFVTSADRPFSASEREVLRLVQAWRRKLAIVVNKTDALETPQEVARVVEFVSTNTQQLVGAVDQAVPVFAVAARRHLRKEGDAGFEQLQRFVLHSLSEGERAAIKLRSPLGAVARVLHGLLAQTEQRAQLLAQDQKVLERLELEMAAWKEGFGRELEQQQAALANILLRLERRAMQFLEETVALSNLYALLMQRAETKRRFENVVVGELGRDVERQLQSTVDWMTDRSRAQVQRVAQLLAEGIAGPARTLAPGAFADGRAELARTVAESAGATLAAFDREGLASELAESLRRAAVHVAALELGALGLAGVLSAALVDVTGILGVGAVAGLGLVVLPYRKKEHQDRLQRLLSDLRVRLARDLESHLERAMVQATAQMRITAQPFAAYVETTAAALADNRVKLLVAVQQVDKFNVVLDKI